MKQAGPDTVVLDACLAITFGNAHALHLITDLTRYQVTIASRALEEVLRPPASEVLVAALDEGRIRKESVDLTVVQEQLALARFDAMPAFRGRGDAEVLALGICRGHAVGTDERAMRRVVRAELGPSHLVSTLDVLVLAVREGLMSADEAVRLLARLDVGPRYIDRLEARGQTLSDLI